MSDQALKRSSSVYEVANHPAGNFSGEPNSGTEVAAASAKYGDDFFVIQAVLSQNKTIHDMIYDDIPFNAERLTNEINIGIDDVMDEIKSLSFLDTSPTEKRLIADEDFRAEFFDTIRDKIVSDVRSAVEVEL